MHKSTHIQNFSQQMYEIRIFFEKKIAFKVNFPDNGFNFLVDRIIFA